MKLSRILDRNVKDLPLLQQLEIGVVKGRTSWGVSPVFIPDNLLENNIIHIIL